MRGWPLSLLVMAMAVAVRAKVPGVLVWLVPVLTPPRRSPGVRIPRRSPGGGTDARRGRHVVVVLTVAPVIVEIRGRTFETSAYT